LDPGETCDPPGSNAGLPNECRANCTFCGDGTLDTGESCDDGNNVSGDGCEADCTLVCDDRKTDFTISLTPKEKFVWMTSKPYNQRGNQIQAYNGETGYMFCWAINDEYDQLEIDYDHLKGDATVLSGTGSAFNYNAIPSLALNVLADKTLHLDGVEYTAGPGQIMFEGLAGFPGAIQGTLAVANPGIDFVRSIQPEFNINLTCWNEVESKFSRHVHFKDFEQYGLIKDLQLEISKIFTLGWHCAATSTHAMWAVLHQNLTPIFQWGDSVWQHPASCVPSTVILPGVIPNPADCGNGALDPGEECDDGNNVSGDGCEPDCTYTPGTTGTCNIVNEPGSLLVYPLIDNINGNTIVNIANTGDQNAVLDCYMVSAPCLP
jgi:cysteine-rich repeat protein